MKIEYKLSANVNGFVSRDTLKTCDNGARAFGAVMRETAKIVGGRITWCLMAPLSIAYYRKITKEAISYHWFLLP